LTNNYSAPAAWLSAGVDFYTFTMSQLQYEHHRNRQVRFALTNRGSERIADLVTVEVLQERLTAVQARGFCAAELAYLAGLQSRAGAPIFSQDYLSFLATGPLQDVHVDRVDGDIVVWSVGAWPIVTFWETVVMSIVNECYFTALQTQTGRALQAEGDARLAAKIAVLQRQPDIKIVDFGTRRRYSAAWQFHVLQQLQMHCPTQLVGTSNVAFAHVFGLKPIGTYAHEMPMVYAALAPHVPGAVRAAHQQFMRDWYARYGADLAIGLTDTFGTERFFADFDRTQALLWRGLRHDSGEPIAFAERVISFYELHGIDPLTKTIVFSDNLTIDRIVALHDRFAGRIQLVYGWGTTLMNDLGVPALNIVMKTTHADGQPTVKLSDHAGKQSGPPEQIARYQHEYFANPEQS
jgi:nicotinate phosphoribosyltransferase